jgi:DDE superfamily endonuclease
VDGDAVGRGALIEEPLPQKIFLSKGSARDLFLRTRCLPCTGVVCRASARRRVSSARYAPGNAGADPYQQARFALAWFRDDCDVERLGAGFGLSRATAYRYRDEAVRVLSDQAPDLQQALERARNEELVYLILDGKIIESDRVAGTKISKKGNEIDVWHSGKTRRFGGNVQALMDPRGVPRWLSDVLPGSEHDLTAAREPVLPILWPYTKTMPVLADGRYVGAGCGVLTPVPQRTDGIPLHVDQRTYNTLLRGLRCLRCLGERGLALLVGRWKILRHVKISPSRITDPARAALVLTHFEHGLIS